ncbi:MAG: EAL domain-containing protein, partial [Arcobacter sp.]
NSKEVFSVFPYLEISKKIKLYEKMMKIMVDKTFALFSNQDIEFSINLSYEDIANEAFMKFLYEKINSYKNPKNIIFEILESDFIEDFSVVKEFTTYVRTKGCKIAIDDFGSGYSNMENILKLKPEIIKIDGSLIKNINLSEESKTIVKNIVNMAKELNAKTVAEYVHSKEVFDIVKNMNIDFLQGFYLSEPKSYFST